MSDYKELGNAFDTNFRVDLNKNFRSVEADVKDVENRISNIVAQAGSDNTEIVDARGPFNVLRERLESLDGQLEEKIKRINQPDFVELLQDHNEVANTLHVRKNGDRDLSVFVPYKGERGALYRLNKDPDDDYIKFGMGSVGNLGIRSIMTTFKNYDVSTETGSFVKLDNNQNWYSNQVGSTFSIDFNGTGFDFRHFFNDQGGDWSLTIDGSFHSRISTHESAVPDEEKESSYAIRPIRNLEPGDHTVVFEFVGDNPNYPPSTGAGTSRGWVRNSSNLTDEEMKNRENNTTVSIYDDALTVETDFNILHNTSNKEYAITIKEAGTTQQGEWIPQHGSVPTVFAVNQSIFFDNELVTDWTAEIAFREVKSVKIIQDMEAYHPDNPNTVIAKIKGIHTVSAKGVSVKNKIEFMTRTEVNAGYGMMFPVYTSFGNELLTSYNNSYASTATDGSRTNLAEDDKAISYAFVNNSGTNEQQDVMVAMTIQNIEKTFRYNQPGARRDSLDENGNPLPVVWLQHRDSVVQKVYPQVYEGHTAEIGETYEVGGTYFIGEFPMANTLLS